MRSNKHVPSIRSQLATLVATGCIVALGVVLDCPTALGQVPEVPEPTRYLTAGSVGATPDQATICTGTLVSHDDDTFEGAYRWDGIFTSCDPSAGTFAANFFGQHTLQSARFALTRAEAGSDFSDIYIWEDDDGVPGAVAFYAAVEIEGIPFWPEVSIYQQSVDSLCVLNPWVGIRPGAGLAVAADHDGPGGGSPSTFICPIAWWIDEGLWYPLQRWHEEVKALGISICTECPPSLLLPIASNADEFARIRAQGPVGRFRSEFASSFVEETEYNRRIFLNRMFFRRIGDLTGRGDVFCRLTLKPLDDTDCRECTQFLTYPPEWQDNPLKIQDAEDSCDWTTDPLCYFLDPDPAEECNWYPFNRNAKETGILAYQDFSTSSNPFNSLIFPDLSLDFSVYDADRDPSEALALLNTAAASFEECVEIWGNGLPIDECAEAASDFLEFVQSLDDIPYVDAAQAKLLGDVRYHVIETEDFPDPINCMPLEFNNTRGNPPRPARVDFVVEYNEGNSRVSWETTGGIGNDDLEYFRVAQKSGSQLRLEGKTSEASYKNTDLFDEREFIWALNVDNDDDTGGTGQYLCGADCYVSLKQIDDNGEIQLIKELYCWTCPCDSYDKEWVLMERTPRKARVDDWMATATINLDWIGYPRGVISSWLIVKKDGQTLEIVPDDPCMEGERLQLTMQEDDLCPEVETALVHRVPFPSGSAQHIDITFTEPMATITEDDISITPELPFQVSHGFGETELRIEPIASSFPPQRYTVQVLETCTDIVGNPLDGDRNHTCGDPYTLEFGVDDQDIGPSDPGGNPETEFTREDRVYVRGSNLPGSEVEAYVVASHDTEGSANVLVDVTHDGPNLVSGTDFVTDLGHVMYTGEFNIVLNMNDNVFYDPEDRLATFNDHALWVGDACADSLFGDVLAWWPFEEQDGSTLLGELEGSHFGTYVPQSSRMPGQIGNAGHFDGSTYVDVGPPEFAESDFSIALWLGDPELVGTSVLLDRRIAGIWWGYDLQLVDGYVQFGMNDGTGTSTFTSNNTVSSGWTHVVVSVNRSSATGLQIYLNGALDSAHDPTPRAGSLFFGLPLRIGSDWSNNDLYVGEMDELIYFHAALPEAEINELFELQLSTLRCPEEDDDVVDTAEELIELPTSLLLHPPQPNPSSGAATFRLSLPGRTRIELSVIDVGGRLVRTVWDGPMDAGSHLAYWDGRDDSGARLPPGVYFARLSAAGKSRSQKLTLIR